MTTPNQPTPEEQEDSPLYYISMERLAEMQRSPIHILAIRRTSSCPSRQKPDRELKDPKKLIAEIARYCGKDEGFIRPEMPLQEIVFRTLLSRRNQPTSLHDLHYELTERWATPSRPINVSKEGLRQILDTDTYYGLDQVPSEPKES